MAMIIDEPTTEYRQPDILYEDCYGDCAETIGRGHRAGDEARCHDCDRLIRWNEERGDWQHCEEPGRGCFLIGAERQEGRQIMDFDLQVITEGDFVLDSYDGTPRLARVTEVDEYEGSIVVRYERPPSDRDGLVLSRLVPSTDFDSSDIIERLHLPLGPGDGEYGAPGGIGCEHCDAIFGTAEEAERHEATPHADEAQRKSMLDDLLPRARGEILADVEAGRVPSDVPGFRTLHDYVDANEYGSPNLSTTPMSVVAEMQEDLDEWIRSGQMRKTWQAMHEEPSQSAVRVFDYSVKVSVTVNTDTREVHGVEIGDGVIREVYDFGIGVIREESGQ